MRFRFFGPNAALASLTLLSSLTTVVACDKMPWAKKADAGTDAAVATPEPDAAPAAVATTPPPADTTAPLDTTVPPAAPLPNTPTVVVKKDGGVVVVDAGAAKVDAAVPVPVPVPTPQPNKPPVPTAVPSGLKLPPNFPTMLPTSWPPKK